jgi:hypothetical protein
VTETGLRTTGAYLPFYEEGKVANDRHNQHHRHCDGVTVVTVISIDLIHGERGVPCVARWKRREAAVARF